MYIVAKVSDNIYSLQFRIIFIPAQFRIIFTSRTVILGVGTVDSVWDSSLIILYGQNYGVYMVPTGSGKPGKTRRQGILIRLEKSGNITQNTGKIRNLIN